MDGHMTLRQKTGGRLAGTPNKRTTELVDRLEALGCDPVQGMAQIAMDLNNPADLRGRMYAELAQYLYPKRRATEIKTDDGPQVIFQIFSESNTREEDESKLDKSRNIDGKETSMTMPTCL